MNRDELYEFTERVSTVFGMSSETSDDRYHYTADDDDDDTSAGTVASTDMRSLHVLSIVR